MNLPTPEEAHALLDEGARRNPGPWVAHSRYAARAARAIAIHHPRLDPTAAYVLACLGDAQATSLLAEHLEDNDADIRALALGGLARARDETDRRLLSRDLNGMPPYLDPQASIAGDWIERAASKLGLPEQEVCTRLEALADRFGLRLAWRDEQHPTPPEEEG